jgi:hypothetical protein
MTDKGQAGFEEELKARVKHLPEVTHVYFFGEEPRSRKQPNFRTL